MMNRLRNSLVLVLAGFLFVGTTALATYHDDAGNGPSEARAITPDAPATAGMINVDIDEDWFSFPVLPNIVYSVRVTDSTVWNTEMGLVAPNGTTGLYETNTASGGSPLSIRWTNWGTLATCYIQINGLVEYTTGTYQVAVTRLNWVDADSDGMSDSWEMNKFGNTTNGAAGDNDGDSLTNLEEYYMNTHPTNFASGLFVANAVREGNAVTVTWPSVRNGAYEVLATSDLDDPGGWSILDHSLNMAGDAFMEFVDADGSTYTSRFYHVRFVY